MKVVWLLPWYPNKHNKMSGIFFKEQSGFLSEKADLSIVYIEQVSPRYFLDFIFSRKYSEYAEGSITVFHKRILSLERLSPALAAELFTIAFEKIYKKRIAKEHPDMIHAHVTLPAGYAACKVGEKYSVPVIITEHATFFDNFFNKKNRKRAQFTLQHADGYIAVSGSLKSKILEYGRNKCEVIPNFIQEKPIQEGQATDTFQIVNVSLFLYKKRIDLLIDAFNLLISSGEKNLKLKIVGDGPLRKNLENKVTQLNLNDFVEFTGLKENDDAYSIVQLSNVLVISSDIETFGVTGIEAMMAGVPVIATKCGGPEDYINEYTGLLIDKNDARQLAEAIQKVRNSEYDRVRIHDFAVDHYGAEAVINKIVGFYNAILNEYKNDKINVP